MVAQSVTEFILISLFLARGPGQGGGGAVCD